MSWIGLGIVQTVWGVVAGEPWDAALGIGFSLLGVAFAWFEVYMMDR